jgi:hypothetical protein
MAPDDILEPEPDAQEPLSIEDDDEPISLVDGSDEGLPGLGGSEGLGLRTLGGAGGEAAAEVEFKRPMNTDGSGATRFRMFHSKISLSPLQNLENAINEWIDGDKIEVKHVGHLIGTMEGKRPEPNLLVMVWY